MSDDLSGFSMMELFRAEAEGQLAAISTGLLALEQGQRSGPTIEPMMCAAHSLKGAARIIGLDPAVKICHAMEDAFVAAQSGKLTLQPAHVDILLNAVDVLTQASQLPEGQTDAWFASQSAAIEKLLADLEGIKSGGPPAIAAAPAKAAPPAPAPQAVAPAPSPEHVIVVSPSVSGDDLSAVSMMDLFRSEAESQTGTLSEGLLMLERGTASPEVIDAMMRAAHSIKGAARVVRLDAGVRVAHVLEDCFIAAQKNRIQLRSEHVDVLLSGVDMINKIAQIPDGQADTWAAANAAELDALIASLDGIQKGSIPAMASTASFDAVPAEPAAPAPPAAAPAPAAAMPAVEGLSQSMAGHETSLSATMDTSMLADASQARKTDAGKGIEQTERVVRVNAQNLSRLMGLAGESLVEARRLRPFADSMLVLKNAQAALLGSLQKLEERLARARSEDDPALNAEMVTKAKQQAQQCRHMLNERLDELESFARRNEDLAGRLHREVLSSRMRPLSDGIKGFPRLVRDVARQMGKKVRYEVKGDHTGVDRDILDKLEAPLNHLIRNALDHGLEKPADRVAAGKTEAGHITLEARHRSGMLQISLSDDGRGIDPARVRAKIVQKNLVTEAMAAQLSEPEVLEFLFLPGFSTAEKVTEISGRGVGLDVVQSMVQAVAGTVRIHSELGKGTTFHMQLPITMSVIRALLVNIGGEPYAFPLTRIDRILNVPMSEVRLLEGRQHFVIDDQPVGLVAAPQVLELPQNAHKNDSMAVVVVSDRSHRFGLVVDDFLGERDLVVRPLDSRLGKVADISSAAVQENGMPVLIIDVEDLVRSIDNLLTGRRLKNLAAEARSQQAARVKRVLVVDDSVTVRELERQLLESRGYHVDVAVDGMDGWNAVRSADYHMVVSDVDMPRMDGIQFVRHIKADEKLKNMPVIIVSYKDREEDRMRGLDAGANSYLTKSSFHDQTFLNTVVDLIGEARE